MRGKGLKKLFFLSESRITPAYAGKRVSELYRRMSSEDHPRLCGEKMIQGDGRNQSLGSPPPMRGKGWTGYRHIRRRGITPAYAGKSAWLFPVKSKIKGSPPPMRGKVSFFRHPPRHQGITPAYAGKSFLACTDITERMDHPRLCGEKHV